MCIALTFGNGKPARLTCGSMVTFFLNKGTMVIAVPNGKKKQHARVRINGETFATLPDDPERFVRQLANAHGLTVRPSGMDDEQAITFRLTKN